MKNIDMRRHFMPSRVGTLHGTVPQNAWSFGLVIQDRNLRGSAFGLRKSAIPFQYIEDANIPSFSKSASYEETQIQGRFEPIKSYTSSSSNEISLSLVYVAEGSEESQKTSNFLPAFQNQYIQTEAETRVPQFYAKESPKTFWTIEQIERISAKIESLVYPQYDGKFSPPSYCLLNIGSIFIDFPVIIKSISVQHKSPFSVRDVRPFRRNINIECSSYFPLYQAISAKDIIDSALKTNLLSSSKGYSRQIYSFKKFQTRSRA